MTIKKDGIKKCGTFIVAAPPRLPLFECPLNCTCKIDKHNSLAEMHDPCANNQIPTLK